MKTVKGFKDAGLEFVAGDVIKHPNGKIKMTEDAMMVTYVNSVGDFTPEWTVEEFAWRGSNACRFTGEIEIRNNGLTRSWRPKLPQQPKAKVSTENIDTSSATGWGRLDYDWKAISEWFAALGNPIDWNPTNGVKLIPESALPKPRPAVTITKTNGDKVEFTKVADYIEFVKCVS